MNWHEDAKLIKKCWQAYDNCKGNLMPGALGSVTVCWPFCYMYFSVSKSKVLSGFTKQKMFHKTIIIAFIINCSSLVVDCQYVGLDGCISIWSNLVFDVNESPPLVQPDQKKGRRRVMRRKEIENLQANDINDIYIIDI